MILTPLLSLLAPHECLGCGAEGSLVCASCEMSFQPAISRCFSCHKADSEARTCASCHRQAPVYAVHAAARYKGIAKDLVWKLKFGRARAAADEIGRMVAQRTDFSKHPHVIITHVPTATNRVRKRGYDQAALIARAVARHEKLPYAPLLARLDKHKQVGASRTLRISQLKAAFRPVRLRSIQGAHIVLIDDVVTTGATLQAAAIALKDAGAARVEAVVFAQA